MLKRRTRLALKKSPCVTFTQYLFPLLLFFQAQGTSVMKTSTAYVAAITS